MVDNNNLNLKKIKDKIRNKLRDYNRRDDKLRQKFINKNFSKTVDINDCLEIVKKHNGICEECNCKLLFFDYQPFCLYQFSFDRIDNSLIHSIDNLRIICYCCNSEGLGKKCLKSNCSRNCHNGTFEYQNNNKYNIEYGSKNESENESERESVNDNDYDNESTIEEDMYNPNSIFFMGWGDLDECEKNMIFNKYGIKF